MEKSKQATWGGRFSEPASERMARFSESVSFDCRLARYDIECSRAHAAMLGHIGILSPEDCSAIREGLAAIGRRIAAGDFAWDPDLEDVHMNIEQVLTSEVPAGARLHAGRSRNDQVATDMRLWFRDAARQIDAALLRAMGALAQRAEVDFGLPVPAYTHLQRAQPVLLSHLWLCYGEMFSRDRERLAGFADRANWCPLGSGALAGSTLPLDRAFVAVELGFVGADGEPRLTANSLDAVADRDLAVEFLNILATIGLHLSRIAEDLILWNTAEFGFVRLPDAYTTGSSLMPQKKNPDALELIRGKSARIVGAQAMMHLLVKAQPLSYNRDLQEDKPPLFDAFDQTRDCLDVLADLLPGLQPVEEKCRSAVADPLLLATDLADALVLAGVPFREAHHRVGALVALSERLSVPINQIPEEEARRVCPELPGDWRAVFDLDRALALRCGKGMPGPEAVRRELLAFQDRCRQAGE